MSTQTQPPPAKQRIIRKTTQRQFFFMTGFIETQVETIAPESTPPTPPGIELQEALTDERPSSPCLRKAQIATVIQFPFRRVASGR
jgi:hypothetical protein